MNWRGAWRAARHGGVPLASAALASATLLAAASFFFAISARALSLESSSSSSFSESCGNGGTWYERAQWWYQR